ncbi:MAG TPA: PaaI family thioesterase [Thermoanaerobaculia bacterium]|nr:PaaI family thioesterase [Thermoanaerobaculia bacterium]
MSSLAKYVEKWLAGQLKLAPITTLLGVKPLSLSQGEAKIEMTAGKHLHNAMGTLHGGIFCDLADVAIGAALATVTAEGESFSTLQLQMSYFLPVVEGRLTAHARVVRRGRGTAHLECDLEDGEGRLVARATSVCAMRINPDKR